MLLGVTITIILPAFILLMLLFEQATSLIELVQKTDFQAIMARLQINERLAGLERYIPGFDAATIQPGQLAARVVETIPGLVAAHGAAVVASFANIVIGFFMMLLAAWFFYTEGEVLVRELIYLSPLPDEYDEEIAQRFRGVVDATFRGQVLTALAQGAVTGVGLMIAGVPAPVLWGAVAALFSLIPMVGAAAVWIPATIYLFIAASITDGGYGHAIFLLIWGIAAVSLVDNLIRPWAMKSGTNMNAIVLFFSIIGGISAFGFVGILLGPLVFALLVTVAHIYKNFFRANLGTQNQGMVPKEAVPAPEPAGAPVTEPEAST
jgi:predicted PurR-regulated permease PerM